jgi:hypothetical protein
MFNNSPTIVDDLTIGTAGTSTGSLLMKGTTSGTVTITVGAEAGTYTLTLPTTDGDASQVLQTNGSGVLSWATVSAGTPTAITVANEATDTSCFPLFATAATGDLGPKTNAGLSFNSSTAVLTATGFSGPLTGNVTGDCSGSSGSCTGNAATATTASAVTNATFTTAITVNTGTVTLTGNVANNSVLTIGAGAVSVSGTNTGDQTLPVKATGAEVDTGEDDAKFVTPKAMEDSSYAKTTAIPSAAAASDLNTGTDTTKFVTSDALAGSNLGIRYVEMTLVDYATALTTGDGKGYFTVPTGLDGMNLVSVHAEVITAGATGTTDIQIYNVTNSQDMLSTKLTIDTGDTGSDTAETSAVINATYDDISSYDVLRIDVDAISTTAPKGLIITMGFQLP